MKRRDFSLATASLVAVSAVSTPALAQKKPQAGKDYLTLDTPVAGDAGPGKIEVIEFFWYSCPHCNAFEPSLEAWIKKLPNDVALTRIPVAFRDSFVPQQRLYYALEALGKLDEMHSKVFNAIHTEKQALNTEEAITAWAVKQGIDKAKFTAEYNSFSMSTKTRKATQIQNAFRVQGVPALGVAGRYYTDGTLAGTTDQALRVVDYLLEQSRKKT